MTIFDPETGKLADPDALRSVRFGGEGMSVPKPVIVDGKKVIPFLHEETGRLGGTSTEHPSGRIDVNIYAESVKAAADSF
jgi:hypothetical protein